MARVQSDQTRQLHKGRHQDRPKGKRADFQGNPFLFIETAFLELNAYVLKMIPDFNPDVSKHA